MLYNLTFNHFKVAIKSYKINKYESKTSNEATR